MMKSTRKKEGEKKLLSNLYPQHTHSLYEDLEEEAWSKLMLPSVSVVPHGRVAQAYIYLCTPSK